MESWIIIIFTKVINEVGVRQRLLEIEERENKF